MKNRSDVRNKNDVRNRGDVRSKNDVRNKNDARNKHDVRNKSDVRNKHELGGGSWELGVTRNPRQRSWEQERCVGFPLTAVCCDLCLW